MYELSEKNKKIVMEMDNLLQGITIADLRRLKGGSFRFPIYINSQAMEGDITDLDISQRGLNCLRRVGIHTVGALARQINGEADLLKIRNLGTISAKDIMFSLFTYQFSCLKPEKKKDYLNKVLFLNGIQKASA